MTRTIDQIAAEIRGHGGADCDFELCRSCTNFVPGEGSPRARIFLIGEAPGAKEDAEGMPFVGAAGRLLAELLDSVGLARGDVFITNVLKARPPENRDPTPAEAAHHWPWLEEQLAAIDPSVIVLLGRHAMARFFGELKISQVHGVPIMRDGRTWLPLYHPAAALYNGSLRQTLLDDFAQLAAFSGSAEE